jgi:LPS-assembly protein
VVLEPLVQVAVSPNAKQVEVGVDAAGQPIYLDEDSLAFEFDETTLFRANKFPGFDLYEDGVRVNVGGRASVFWDDGRRASLLVGRSFRDQSNDIFPARTGLREASSDWIVAAEAQPVRGLSMFTRARLDGDSLDVQRAEAGANFSLKRASGFFRYLRDNTDINGVKRENLDLGGDLQVTEHWGVSAYGNRDMVQDAWVIRDVGVYYRDECTRVDIIYRREDTAAGRPRPPPPPPRRPRRRHAAAPANSNHRPAVVPGAGDPGTAQPHPPPSASRTGSRISRTRTVRAAVEVPSGPVTVSRTSYSPSAAQACVGRASVDVVPSPKSQA